MTKTRVFLSYHFEKDALRAEKIREMFKHYPTLEFSEAMPELNEQLEAKMQAWIDEELDQSDCLVVLIGEETAKKKWINYAIKQAYEKDLGIVGVFVHRLLDEDGEPSERGADPFHFIDLNGIKFSRFVKRFESEHVTHRYVYHDIRRNLEPLMDDAIEHSPSTWDWDIYR